MCTSADAYSEVEKTAYKLNRYVEHMKYVIVYKNKNIVYVQIYKKYVFQKYAFNVKGKPYILHITICMEGKIAIWLE